MQRVRIRRRIFSNAICRLRWRWPCRSSRSISSISSINTSAFIAAVDAVGRPSRSWSRMSSDVPLTAIIKWSRSQRCSHNSASPARSVLDSVSAVVSRVPIDPRAVGVREAAYSLCRCFSSPTSVSSARPSCPSLRIARNRASAGGRLRRRTTAASICVLAGGVKRRTWQRDRIVAGSAEGRLEMRRNTL